jgi:ATP-dependent exoDNAse (exonuclease V) beta subunit
VVIRCRVEVEARHTGVVAVDAMGNQPTSLADGSSAAHDHILYWDSFWDADQVFYGHVLGFKGLERRAVVLVVNEKSALERSRERLYVGLSRARDELVVCGDPGFIREVGGPDLARRLNLPSTSCGDR